MTGGTPRVLASLEAAELSLARPRAAPGDDEDDDDETPIGDPPDDDEGDWEDEEDDDEDDEDPLQACFAAPQHRQRARVTAQ